MVIHVAIAVSQRVECLNLFLDILKNNFNNSYVTHVFCNLSEVDMKTYGKYIDASLIDHFYHFPDDCSMKQKTYGDRVKHKRIQPLRFIKKIFETMSRNTNFEKFIYTECDVYPLVEEDYVRYYEKIIDEKLFAYCVLKKEGNRKGPNGLIIPSPIYIHNIHAKKISDSIYENSADDDECSFEGLLMTAIKNSGINLEAISYSAPDNCNFEKNLSRETMTTHQHNILNLHQPLRESKILSGNWVREVLENEKIYEIHSGEELLKNENFKLQYCCGCTNDSLCVYHKPSPTTKNLLDLIKKMEFEVMALNDSLQFVRNKRS